MIWKVCNKCKIKKKLNNTNFNWRTDSNSWRNECKKCILKKSEKYKDQRKLYYTKNREIILKKKKIYAKKNKKKIRKYNKKYHIKNNKRLKEYRNRYYKANIDVIHEKQKKYRSKPNIKKRILKNNRKYYKENREQILKQKKEIRSTQKYILYRRKYESEYWLKRMKNEPEVRLRRSLGRHVLYHLKTQNVTKAGASFWKYVNYTPSKLKQHIESLFEPWMSWSNWGKYSVKTWNDNDSSTWTWQIDHIIPQSKLPYDSMEHKNFKKIWSLRNLRPFSAKQNIIESSRGGKRKWQKQ